MNPRSLDIASFAARAARERTAFAAASPFPHVVIDDFLKPEAAEAMLDEFDPPAQWIHYHHVNEKKIGCNDFARLGSKTREVIADLNAPAFLAALETLTGVIDVRADPDLDGGGIQQMFRDGFLNVHTDFLAHAKRRRWSRQLNLLLFLNKDWPEGYQGNLELWDPEVRRCVRRIEPLFNRCVIFHTSGTSFHGVPEPVACPPTRSRTSLALYYFREEDRACRLTPTYYVPRPDDPLHRRALIRLDRWLLYAYSALKRYTPLGDAMASRRLRR